jgi:hypothetical protein
MRLIRTLFRVLIILPIYGWITSMAFTFLVWVLLKALIFISEIFLGTEPAWNINHIITKYAMLIAPFFIILGSLLNLIVFVANGFRMPVKDLQKTFLLHRSLDSSTRLPLLADIIQAPLGIRVSIGDLFVFTGLALLLFIYRIL